jgi:DNA-binding MarR family transcriptional regulator
MAVDFIKNQEGKALSGSAYKIIEIIEKKGFISASELTSELEISTRTIHYSLKRLLESKYINKKPFLNDMRQTRYSISDEVITSLEKAKNESKMLKYSQ